MSETKKRGKKLEKTRAEKEAEQARAWLLIKLGQGAVVPVDRSKVSSKSAIPVIPDYYRDVSFICRDCGKRETWTAKQQKRWYEEQGGEIETIAIRCRACRHKERSRQELARKVHLDGLERKKASQNNKERK